MRAYLTVILDSFHEAFASRVLYILLLVMTVVLAGLVPLGYTEQRMLQFHRRDIREWPAFLKELRRQSAADAASPGKRIIELAGDPLAKTIKDSPVGSELTSPQVNEVIDGLNSLLSKPALYDENSWRGVRLRDTTQKLLKQGPANLGQDDLAYLNRLLLRDAFPTNLGSIGDKELYVYYAWWTLPEPIPGGKQWFPQVVKATLAAFMDLFVGSLAIFVAILVTSPIIPRTFEPGAIDLLLSKPVSRSLLIVAKYLGGCAFILLSAGYFIAGLWLIVGLRMDVWSEKLLLCIPIFMFQFAIYYAVSMLAGVIWRNAVVSIVVTVLFFLSCFTVGTAKIAIEQTMIKPHQLVHLVAAKEGIVGTTRSGQFVQWNEAQQSWDEVLQQPPERRGRRPMGPMMGARIVGPVYHRPTQSLLYLRLPGQPSPRGFMGGGSQFLIAKWSGNWTAQTGPTPPGGAAWVLQDGQGNLLLVGPGGVFAYEPTPGDSRPPAKIFGIELPLAARDDPFVRVGPPDDVAYNIPYSAAIDPQTNRVIIDNPELLMLLARDEKAAKYVVQQSVKHEPEGATLLGLTKNRVVVVNKSGEIQLRGISNLLVEHRLRPAGDSPPLAVETSPDGRYVAVLFHNGRLWLYDDQSAHGSLIDRQITATAFDGTNLIYADSLRQVRVRDVAGNTASKTYSPKLDTLRWYYQWLIQPVYFVFPKPGELSNLVRSLVTEDLPRMPQFDNVEDLREVQETPDTTAPVIHGAIFVLIMLAITCLYVERLDL